MYKKYDSYRYQVMWNHPKLMVNDPRCILSATMRPTSWTTPSTMPCLCWARALPSTVYDTKRNERVKNFDEER